MMRRLLSLVGLGSSPPPQYPPLPPGDVAYIVGDIHGCIDPLRRTLRAIEQDMLRRRKGEALEIYLGDYVDRGPDSAGVIDLLRRRGSQRSAVFLRGNHDAMMEAYVRGRGKLREWLPLGGGDTLRSYGATPEMIAEDHPALRTLIPREHLEFLAGCSPSWQLPGYFFTHAGVRPGIALEDQSPEDLMWIREEFLSSRRSFGAIVVHGHTPVPEPEFRFNRIGIDTGAYMTGRLCCLRIDESGPHELRLQG